MTYRFPLAGDRVRIKSASYRSGHEGVLAGIDKTDLYSHTVRFPDGGEQSYKAIELERIDESPEMGGTESVAVSAGVAGQPDDDASGSGSAPEPEAEEPPVASDTDDPPQGKALTRVLDRLGERLEMLEESPGSSLDYSESFSRRMRINITKNTKGYNHDITFEIIATDPRTDLQRELADGLRLADRLARQAITEAEYTDAEGPPGADDNPF